MTVRDTIKKEKFAAVLIREGRCASTDEAGVVSEMIVDDMNETGVSIYDTALLVVCLQEHLDLTKEEAHELATHLRGCDDAGADQEDHQDEIVSQSNESDTSEEENECVVLFEGECELCDRYIKLTKHHLIPKSTWPRMQSRLLHAAQANILGETDNALVLLGPGLAHLLDDLEVKKQTIRRILHRTCDICRPCHTAVHKAHDNTELALGYSTIDLILADSQVAKFCKWASKQRAGRYAVK